MVLSVHRVLFAPVLMVALVVSVAFAAEARVAAQPASSPAPGGSPPPTAPTTSTDKVAPKTGEPALVPAGEPSRVNYTPVIDITPQTTFATGGDYTPGQPVPQGLIRIGGKITEAITKNLSASYQHGYINEAIGNPGFQLNGFVDDPIDDFRLNYAATKQLSAALGYFYRHRTCCKASNDPTNLQPITVHEGYLQMSYAFAAIPGLGGSQLSLSGRITRTLSHKPTPASVLAANPQIRGDEGNKYWPTAGALVTVPVDPKSGLTAFGSYAYAKDYFDFQPIAFWYNIIDYGFTRTVSPALSFTLGASNLTQHKQGYPFAGFNTIHRTRVVLSADIHLPGNR